MEVRGHLNTTTCTYLVPAADSNQNFHYWAFTCLTSGFTSFIVPDEVIATFPANTERLKTCQPRRNPKE